MQKAVVLSLISLALFGCGTTQEQAAYFAKDLGPTIYQERGFFDPTGYSDGRVDENTSRVTYRANSLTSYKRVVNLLRYHAANMARAKGEDTFSFSSASGWIQCAPIADTGIYASALIHFGATGASEATMWQTSEVLGDFSTEASAPTADYQQRQRNFVVFQETCDTRTAVDENDVLIQSELLGNQTN